MGTNFSRASLPPNEVYKNQTNERTNKMAQQKESSWGMGEE